MAVAIRPLSRGWVDAASRAAVRTLLLAVVGLTLFLAPTSPRSEVLAGLSDVTRRDAFSVVGWEIGALAAQARVSVGNALRAPSSDPAEQVRIVRDHFANVAEIRRLRERRDGIFARAPEQRAGLAEVEAELASREVAFDRDKGTVATIVGGQIDLVMREEGLRGTLLNVAPGQGWPIPFLRIDPEVFFSYERLPQNLVIARRDRIGIVGSVLVSPDLSTAEIERLERRADGLGVSSLVSAIGGFGSYPSMIPDADSLRRGLDVIAHEWVHHYLAFRPLGRGFFDSYDMRSVNETVADIVGNEIGSRAFERYYRATEPQPPTAAPQRASAEPRRDFGVEMRRIRADVERLLAAGDVDGAERYMAEQRGELAKMGWQVRRLNTAYLAFFGAYSGGANRYEAPLRAMRERAGSTATFLREVERLTSPAEVLTAR